MNVYLDYAATAPISDNMRDYLISILNTFGNPSSLHSIGESAKEIISNTRLSVAKFINTTPENIYFTSGGSASNTLGIRGYCSKNNCCILYSSIAHKSIFECAKNHESYSITVNHNGFIDIEELERSCLMHPKALVVIDYANSEIGTVQKVKEIIDIVHSYNGVVYLDCTGSISTIPLDVQHLDVDICGFSAHKLGGLKGCGVLYKKSNIDLEPLVYGSQEQGLIGGTENVLGIASLYKSIEDLNYSSITSENRDYVYHYIIKNIQNCYLIGSLEKRLPHNLYMCFQGIEGESLMIMLDMNGIQVSTGSACNSGSITPSNTLTAIGMDKDDIHSCIRMTFSGNESIKELDYVCKKLNHCIHQLRSLSFERNVNEQKRETKNRV